MVGSPAAPRPGAVLAHHAWRSTPLRRSTSAVPSVARISNPRSASRLTGKIMARLSRLATDTNTVPGRQPAVRRGLDLANAVPKSASKPMTSPVERISGPSTVSTTWPSVVRNRLNGSTASLTAIGASSRQRRRRRRRGQHALGPQLGDGGADHDACRGLRQRDRRRLRHERHRARGPRVRLEHVEHVGARANCTFSSPRTPMPRAMASVDAAHPLDLGRARA